MKRLYTVRNLTASSSPMQPSVYIFDRARLRQHRDRAVPLFGAYDFLLREMASRLADRLPDIKRSFPVALNLGAHNGLLADYLPESAGIKTLVQAELSAAMLAPAPGLRAVADEEFLPFAENSFDLVMSVGALHWVNDLPGTLIQINRVLKPGGVLLASMPGGETLKELRDCLETAEVELTGGVSPRISPFVDVRDAGSLLQRAGFQLPVADSEILTITYDDPVRLMADLRGMGEASVLVAGRKHFTRRSVLFRAMERYQQYYLEAGRVPATIDIVTMTGWKQDAPAA